MLFLFFSNSRAGGPKPILWQATGVAKETLIIALFSGRLHNPVLL